MSLFQEPGNNNPIGQVPNGSDASTLIGGVWVHILNIAFAIIGWLAVIFLIWAGVQYITSTGAPEKAKQARAMIQNAILGIIVLITAYTIVAIISGTAGSLAGLLNPT